MIHILVNKLRQLWSSGPNIVTNTPPTAKTSDTAETYDTESNLAENLTSACTTITFYIREDGEFAVSTEIKRNNEAAMDMTGTVLHMINSGLLAEYVLQSLDLWAEQNTEYKPMVLEIIKKWKDLFDEDIADSDNPQSPLAIDPTEVFSLKSLSQKDFT